MLRAMCFNSQPPEGGWSFDLNTIVLSSGFNSQPPEGGWPVSIETLENNSLFQLTAARRRLAEQGGDFAFVQLFQLTAAPMRLGDFPSGFRPSANGFNSQPPEGGWPTGD